MAVNLSKNRLALLTAYQDVIDESTATDCRIMYGFCSLKEPAATLPRYILINWVGEDVPDARKCACASHVATIAEFFQVSLPKGVDVIINASSMDDIDPSAIGQRLTNGTVPVASPVLSRLRMRDEENSEHVGTTYQKTNAEFEMKKINREEFWEQAKREEEIRKEEERKKAVEERQRFEEERMELERKEQEEREKRYRERERQIEEHSNPREYFKQREKAVATSVDTSPVATHRTDDFDEGVPERNMAAVSPTPIPKIAIQEEKEDSSCKEWAPESPQRSPVQESGPTKPVQSVAPQTRSTDPSEDSLLDLWESSPAPAVAPSQATHIMDLMGDVPEPAEADSSPNLPQPLLSFDETPDTTFCPGPEDDPSSLVDVAGPHQMTLSYQQALQHASGTDSQELDDSQLLMTNGDTLLKEGTQASEGYFSQSQEEDFAQSDECSAKVNPTPVFYNKPPEIDITCWDTDPVMDDDD
uniref:Drebrin 1 n=1 Tax=Astyanax mexicanus TaxID=7994 RepID=A0A8B9JCU9_ASTMX